MMNDAEMLWEERIMLENLTVKDCMFHDTTVLNTYTIQGRLPEEKLLFWMRSICFWHPADFKCKSENQGE